MDKTHFQINLSVIILNDDKKILLGKRSDDDDIFPGLWGIPGGKMEITDKTIEESLQREVIEEMGVDIKDVELVSNNARVHNDIHKLFMVFIANYKSGEPKALEETSEVKWFDYSELSREIMTPYTYDIIKSVFENHA